MILAAFNKGGEWVLRKVGYNGAHVGDVLDAGSEEQTLLTFAFDGEESEV
jgi:hypothetical protein